MGLEYWENRKHLEYYRLAVSLVVGESVLDVGAATQHGCEYMLWLPESVAVRHTVERGNPQGIKLPGVVQHFRDFMSWNIGRKFDTLLCLQTIEHVTDPRAFAEKLLATAERRVVVSIPHEWTGSSPHHNGLSVESLTDWFGGLPDATYLADRRLIAVYRTPQTSPPKASQT